MEEDTWNKIIDIRANGSLSHFLSYFSVMELSSPFLKTSPSFLTLKKGSTFLTKPLFLQEREDVTAPSRCSEPLRYKVGGPKRSSPYFAGWDRLTIACCSGGQLADWDRMAY